MFWRFWAWLECGDLEQRRRHAGAHYALALAAGDTRRAKRLKTIINALGEKP